MSRVRQILSGGFIFVVGCFLLYVSSHGIFSGMIYRMAKHSSGGYIHREQDPSEFWLLEFFYSGCGIVFICVALMFFNVDVMGLFRFSGRMRKEAGRFGISVDDVERDMPEIEKDGKSYKLARGRCVRYSLPRHGKGTRSPWSLLQRTKSDGAQFPNGYLLQGNISEDLRHFLMKLAGKYSGEYFEFEGTPTDVCVYWEEWGGVDQVRHLHKTLQTLAGL